jgi:hypothetical protein
MGGFYAEGLLSQTDIEAADRAGVRVDRQDTQTEFGVALATSCSLFMGFQPNSLQDAALEPYVYSGKAA